MIDIIYLLKKLSSMGDLEFFRITVLQERQKATGKLQREFFIIYLLKFKHTFI